MSNKSDNQSQPGKTKIIRLHQQDNVIVALEDLAEGSQVKIGDQELVLTEPISAKHKFALSDLSEGDYYLYVWNQSGSGNKTDKTGSCHNYGEC